MRSALHPLRSTVALLSMLTIAAPALADSAADTFHRAYYLEHEQGDYAGAAKLYAEVASDSSAPAELKSRAAARRAACVEEQGSGDFATLMPPESLAYVELTQPGQRILGLLRGLGLVDNADAAAKVGSRRAAISPALIKELIGIRGIAAAVTGFDPFSQMPSGVAILHPGNVEVLRGLAETALPAAAKTVKPIGGFATYEIEGTVLVTLTHRLIIVSQQPSEIEGVIRRMKGDEKESLATNEALQDVLRDRGDALLYFCVNARPIMPIVNALLAAAGSESRELAIAQAVLDLNSLQALSGQLAVGEEGLRLDVSIRLAEGHHNLVYNFLRMPALDRSMLKCIPAGAAGFAAFSLNPAAEARSGDNANREGGRPIVTAMDIGREIFGNVVSIGAFVLPGGGSVIDGVPIPDLAAVMTVNDADRSAALWGQFLGIASLAAGGRSIDGEAIEIEGAAVRSYALPGGVTIMLATSGSDILISPSRTAITRAIAAKRGGETILDDPAFRSSLDRLDPNSTVAVFAHAGRCFDLARPHMDDDDLEEAAPFAAKLENTVASLVITHSDQLYRLSLMVTGLPRVDDLLTQLLEDGEIHAPRRTQSDADGRLESRGAERHAKADAADAETPVRLASATDDSDDARRLEVRFERLVAREKDAAEARAAAEKLAELAGDDEKRLNDLAWRWLTEERYAGRYNDVALQMAKRCNEVTQYENWIFVDTLAWAHFKTGDVTAAIELEQKALKLCEDKDRVEEVQKALKKFELAREDHSHAPVAAGDLR